MDCLTFGIDQIYTEYTNHKIIPGTNIAKYSCDWELVHLHRVNIKSELQINNHVIQRLQLVFILEHGEVPGQDSPEKWGVDSDETHHSL